MKALQDKFYRHTLERLGAESLAPAGFFEDENHTGQSLLDLRPTKSIDIRKIIKNIKALTPEEWSLAKKQGSLYVLLNTGSYNPVHEGHIKMLELAKETLNPVVGAILSPSHDKYVSTKDPNFQMSASKRIWLCEQIVWSHDYITVDSWEALEHDYPINFTDVLERTQYVLNTVLADYLRDIKIEVVYVFGSDNESFADAFIGEGLCVCVPRHHTPQVRHNRMLVSKPNIELSSTELRQYTPVPTFKQEGKYLIRDDSAQCVNAQVCIDNFAAVFKDFVDNVELLPMNKYCGPHNTVNLDVWSESLYPLRVSRLFHVNSAQLYSEELHFHDFKQIEHIKRNLTEYTLVDDDVATGFTVGAIQKILEPLVCRDILTLNPYKDFYDIVDIRDFIIGSKNGGLLCYAPTGVMRVPYLYPYVNLFARARIPLGREIEFSKRILEINIQIYTKRDSTLGLCPKDSQSFFYTLGYKNSDRLADIASDMLEKI